jgi:multiple sugar transport system permease protein
MTVETQAAPSVARHRGDGPVMSPGQARARLIWDRIAVRIFLVVMSLAFLLPLYWMLITSVKSNEELGITPSTIWPQAWHWDNYIEAFKAFPFATFFGNSVLITVLSVVGSVLSCVIAAYGFSCIEWRGRDKVFYLVLATLFIPFPIAIIPVFDLFAALHWINTYFPLVVPHFFGSAFFIFLLRQFLLQIPREHLDAARIDGASEWQILWRIVFPMSLPAISAVAIFTAVGSWNDFLGPLLYLQDEARQTLAIGIQAFRTSHDIQFNLLMAASLMILLPLVILFFAAQRVFIRGITLGSFK